ncbi:MAG: 1-acyl-sn-glycerol-3-phosphate acyltransferase [Chloroflexi bacterium]|nr:1-acyl-sn-glycerol-3-phosphate acyltransferase [Chloroflexota bacterium]
MSVSAAASRPVAFSADPRMYRALRWLVTWIMRILYNYRVTGQENVPPAGRLIVAVNHLHLFDPFATAPAVPRQITTLAAEKWQRPGIVGWFLRSAGVIFVRRGEVDRQALRACLSVLEEDKALAIAPEGTRSKTHSLQRAKPGIAYLATRSDAPILPVTVWGVERLRDWKHFRRPTCRVVIGRPFRLPKTDGKASTEDLQRYADLVMLRLGRELPEEYRGVYAERIAALEAGESDELAALR